MTIRRVLLATTIALAASAAGALAFAPERSPLSRVLNGGSAWLGRRFTPVPASADNAHRAAASLLKSEIDSAVGTYCRFPENGEPIRRTISPATAAPGASDSDLLLETQSLIPGDTAAAICVGEPVPSAVANPGPGIVR